MSRLLCIGFNVGDSVLFIVVGGEGVYFYFKDGCKLIDGSNIGGGFGYCYFCMVEVICNVVDIFVVNEGWIWVGWEQVVDDLMDIVFVGEDWVGGVCFCIFGSEVNDMVLLLCQVFMQKFVFVMCERVYYGIVGLL